MKANAITEAEAVGKWCPDARTSIITTIDEGKAQYAPGNRTNYSPYFERDARCISSRCMAWRWISGSEQAGTGRGYCGRAGRP
jgi:hypothetical protein